MPRPSEAIEKRSRVPFGGYPQQMIIDRAVVDREAQPRDDHVFHLFSHLFGVGFVFHICILVKARLSPSPAHVGALQRVHSYESVYGLRRLDAAFAVACVRAA